MTVARTCRRVRRHMKNDKRYRVKDTVSSAVRDLKKIVSEKTKIARKSK